MNLIFMSLFKGFEIKKKLSSLKVIERILCTVKRIGQEEKPLLYSNEQHPPLGGKVTRPHLRIL